MTQTFLRIVEVVRATGLPRSTIYEMVGKGVFPKQVSLSPRAVGWVESEVIDWQRARIADRDAHAHEMGGANVAVAS
jgi:prophage regulatory protein